MIIIYKQDGIISHCSLETYLDLKQSGKNVKILGRGYYRPINNIKQLADNKASLYTKALGIKPAAFYLNLPLSKLIHISPIYKYQKYESFSLNTN